MWRPIVLPPSVMRNPRGEGSTRRKEKGSRREWAKGRPGEKGQCSSGSRRPFSGSHLPASLLPFLPPDQFDIQDGVHFVPVVIGLVVVATDSVDANAASDSRRLQPNRIHDFAD